MKPRHLLMGAALLAAAGLVLFGDTTPSNGVAEPVERAPRSAPVAAPRAPAPAADAATTDNAILRLVPRSTLIGEAGEAAFRSGEGVFLGQNWNPPPPPPPPGPVAPPQPPSAPPLPFAFIGKSVTDGQWEVYLARGEQTYVVHNKTVIDGTYRVESIAPPTLTVTYLPMNQVQQLNIGVIE
ncbi:hypothetical protein [Massilia endophytica]|uniref:hypothetical protein n=1 Tax=Massilia endophytica TaxID=2899220 RepID=UPI001E3D3C9D|nr:hypothetical protein [Massilia endophytica]UGQ47666.1 hypothetical protein LSQ66_04070 [Massilia endophytica]